MSRDFFFLGKIPQFFHAAEKPKRLSCLHLAAIRHPHFFRNVLPKVGEKSGGRNG